MGRIRRHLLPGRKGKGRSDNPRPYRAMVLDGHGMPVGFSHMLVVDEFGNVGMSPKDHERTFGFALTDVVRPDVFESLTEYNRQLYDGEVKARRDGRKQTVLSDISTLGLRTYGTYIDKEDPPRGWDRADRAEVMRDVLDFSLGEVMKDLEGNVYIVVDHHSSYRGKVTPMIRAYSDGTRIVDGGSFDSEGGQFEGVLQTQDHVASAMRGYAELKDDTRVRKLGTMIRRISKKDMIGKGV